MAKDEIDVRAEREKILAARQKKIDAEIAKAKEENDRMELTSGFNNPPAVRATDGGEPGTKERNPLEVADEAAETEVDEDGPQASEAAIKLAEENGIDLSTVAGTGKSGNITKADVQALIDARA